MLESWSHVVPMGRFEHITVAAGSIVRKFALVEDAYAFGGMLYNGGADVLFTALNVDGDIIEIPNVYIIDPMEVASLRKTAAPKLVKLL